MRPSPPIHLGTPADAAGHGGGVSGPAGARAFTLLEVLLAVVVFSIVLSAVHVVFYGAVRLRDKTMRSIDASVAVRQTVEILRRDLSNLTWPGGVLSGTLQSSAVGGLQSGTTLGTASAANLPGGAVQVSPALYTTAGIIDAGAPWGEVERVIYFLAEPTNRVAGRDLFRSVSHNLLPVLQDQPDNQWLMGGVDNLFFSFFDGTQWRDTWDSTGDSNALPVAIRVQLQLTSEPARTGLMAPVELVIPMSLYAPTNQTTSSTSAGGAS